MCGILFIEQDYPGRLDAAAATRLLERQRWRGPDAMRLSTLDDGRVHLGHNRLAIIDPVPRSDQPMRSADGRYTIVFNGEIYNFRALRRRHGLVTATESDTETLLAGYQRLGEAFLEELEGMYAFVIHDAQTRRWIAARDAIGIKPLYLHRSTGLTVIASEPAVVAAAIGAPVDAQSVAEWRLIRRPVPGASFFVGVHELLPGTLLRSDGSSRRLWSLARSRDEFDPLRFEDCLRDVVREHEISDVGNVALLSGGIDSAVVMALSQTARAYSVGLTSANEFAGAADTAQRLGRELRTVGLAETDLAERWRELARLRGEPLAVPNEGLIHAVCSAMGRDEKVVLTGEGADELLFGYDRIYRWALATPQPDLQAFLARYGYSDTQPPTPRLLELLGGLAEGARTIDFVEDFFFTVHLPGLLRRMDFAAMAAAKEARVPFADRRLVALCYRAAPAHRLDAGASKLPLRRLLERIGLVGPLTRAKIGFSATPNPQLSRYDEYRGFQDLMLKELAWS
ncbi:MAG TPA: asparagine synthetase B [Burkholderiaceae bacterium]|nr:asparagine synthetase B [Burkholderiaceae bacterium]